MIDTAIMYQGPPIGPIGIEMVGGQVDWSMFYPAHYLAARPEGLALLDPSVEIMCAHFVMFHPKVVGTIIGELEAMLTRPGGHPLGGPMHVDGAYLTIRKRHNEIR